MGEPLPLKQNPPLDLIKAFRIIDWMLQGEVPTARDLIAEFGITLEEAVALMRHPDLLRGFRNIKEAQASLEFDAHAWDAAMAVIKNAETKDGDRIYAIKTVAELLGRAGKKTIVNLPGSQSIFAENLTVTPQKAEEIKSRQFPGYEE